MKKSIYLIFFIFLFSLNPLYSKSYPSLYSQLGTPLFESVEDFNHLSKLNSFGTHQQEIQDFARLSTLAIGKGTKLDISGDKKGIKGYLKSLRQLQALHDRLEKTYKQQLYKSIYSNNKKDFFALLQRPLSLVSKDARLKKKVVEFYTKTGKKDSSYLNALRQDYALDERSYAHLNKMFQIHQEKKEVTSKRSLNTFVALDNAKKKIEVVSLRVKGGFDLYLDNHTYNDVSIKLQAKNMQNIRSEFKLPYMHSYPPRSRSKIIHFSIINVRKKSIFNVSYSAVIGSLSPNYDKNYVYALPYQRGKSYLLSQGFNGNVTHKGSSSYALDFSMPVGSHVHAMRDGIVTGLESKHNEHGFSSDFASKANYIIIKHEDGTMAMYGHLKQDGVRVNLGQRVYKHQLIGYSGNTGYSSGPHLHVHISAITSFAKGSNSVPFIFVSKTGKINSPVEKTYYRAH
ncbi:MAG: hypothetical protein COA44_06835 [Arcobacter sp.]|nr:MAG: hypothetical protein COA44_06835 [Arcobacter sp.]